MSSSKITLMGFYKWFADQGEDLFKNLSLPDGIDKDTFVNRTLLKGAEFEVLYSNPDFMQEAIGNWSDVWQRTFTKWYEALQIEYDPLNNYDRTEVITDANTGTVKNTGTQGNVNKVSAFNSSTMQDNATDTRTDDLTMTNDLTLTHNARIKGNIGVTTSQQMLQAQLDISYWNLYDHMADVFLQEFVIPVY